MARTKVYDGNRWIYQDTEAKGNTSTVLTSWDVMPSNPKVGDIATNVNDSSYSALVVQDRTLSFNGGVQVLNRELIL